MHESSPVTEPSAAPCVTAGDELIGRRLGKYDIARVIGRGGMGTVYEAVNSTIGKRVALKVIDASMAQNGDAVARFQREARAASAVESAHIVQIFDSGTTDDGVPYLVMELLRGEDLGCRIRRCGRLELSEALRVVAQLLRGLRRAHEAGIVHRDLKPDNVFLVERDDDPMFAKILDFGISKMARPGDAPARTLTRQGTVLGTPFYMSPEQAQALADVDGRTDLWAVGAILYECLTGRPPHGGGSYEQVIVNICMKDADDVRIHNPGVDEPLARVIARSLCRDRDGRFATASEFLEALVDASGNVLSSRAARASLGASPSARPTATSTPSGRTPPGAVHPLDATLDARADAPSRVGWSTVPSRRAGPARRLYAGAAVVLLAGTVGAVAYHRQHGAPPVAPTQASSVEIELKSRVAGARFWVDGVEVMDGRLRGTKGEHKKVRVEAPGYVALDSDIVLDPSALDVSLDPAPAAAPAIAPAPPEPSTEPGPAASVSASASPRSTVGKSQRAVPVPAVKTAEPTASAAPKPGGVAPSLQIKTE